MIAYLDAGTGSMLMAAFAGGLAGIFVLVRLYWHRFLGLFSKKHRTAAEETFGDLMGKTPTDP
jgi:cytochrome c biogenesis protein CcdA